MVKFVRAAQQRFDMPADDVDTLIAREDDTVTAHTTSYLSCGMWMTEFDIVITIPLIRFMQDSLKTYVYASSRISLS